MTELSKNALTTLEKRYFQPGEDWDGLCRRVAHAVAKAEKTPELQTEWEEKFYEVMNKLWFLPNSPTLMNAGKDVQMLAACFALPIEDSIVGIFNAIKWGAMTHMRGGGTGYNFSNIRAKGEVVASSGKYASGPISFMNAFDAATETIAQGGVRRGANMALLNCEHPDVMEFIECKNDTSELTNFNISVAITNDFMSDVLGNVHGNGSNRVFDTLVHQAWSTGEPGVVFMDRINEDNPVKHLGDIDCVNPCVSGDTLVAVADGRNFVSIKELAEEGVDVPVHCVNPTTREPHIRMGRIPRITGRNAQLYKVTLDDGSSIRVTDNHRFVMRDGAEKTTLDLLPNDSLMAFNKRQEPNTTTGKRYWKISNLSGKPLNEHSMIYSEFVGIDDGKIIHHVDEDGLNNRLSNLTQLTISEHNKIHPQICVNDGENNGMYGKHHSEETKAKISSKTKEFFSNPENRLNMSRKMSAQMTPERRAKIAERMTKRRVVAICPICGKESYMTETKASQYKYCSIVCANTRVMDIDDMIRMGHECIEECGKLTYAAWCNDYAKLNPTRPSVKLLMRYFGLFSDFSKQCKDTYNHKIVSIEDDGIEDVYNITVDEFHTVAYITNTDCVTPNGNNKLSGLYTFQCGELPLMPFEACNLGSINLSKMVNDGVIDEYRICEVTKTAVRFLDDVIDVCDYPLPQIDEMVKGNRKIGLGVMGFADMLINLGVVYGSVESFDHAGWIMDMIASEACDYELKLGAEKGTYPNQKRGALFRNATHTCVAPTGSISIIAGCSGGIEPLYALNLGRGSLDGELGDELYKPFEVAMREHGFSMRDTVQVAKDGVVYHHMTMPSSVEPYVTAHEVSPENHVRMLAAFQAHVDNAVSKSVNLPNSATEQDVRDAIILAYKLGCKGLTVYRDGSREQVLTHAGTETSTNVNLLAERFDFNEDADAYEASNVTHMREIPKVTEGKTHSKQTGCGTLHVTINEDSHGVCEVFGTLGKAGGCPSAHLEAQCRMISMGLRSGNDVNDIIDQLRGISCPNATITTCKSCSDAIGIALSEHCGSDDRERTVAELPPCTECGSKTIPSGSKCTVCTVCGHGGCS